MVSEMAKYSMVPTVLRALCQDSVVVNSNLSKWIVQAVCLRARGISGGLKATIGLKTGLRAWFACPPQMPPL